MKLSFSINLDEVSMSTDYRPHAPSREMVSVRAYLSETPDEIWRGLLKKAWEDKTEFGVYFDCSYNRDSKRNKEMYLQKPMSPDALDKTQILLERLVGYANDNYEQEVRTRKEAEERKIEAQKQKEDAFEEMKKKFKEKQV